MQSVSNSGSLSSLFSLLAEKAPQIYPIEAKPATEEENAAADQFITQFIEKYCFNGNSASSYASDLQKTSSTPSTICGHVFLKNELHYTCRQCASDPTCVFCANCFNNGGHRSHAYKVSKRLLSRLVISSFH